MVRTNYDSLTLKLQDSLDQYEVMTVNRFLRKGRWEGEERREGKGEGRREGEVEKGRGKGRRREWGRREGKMEERLGNGRRRKKEGKREE